MVKRILPSIVSQSFYRRSEHNFWKLLVPSLILCFVVLSRVTLPIYAQQTGVAGVVYYSTTPISGIEVRLLDYDTYAVIAGTTVYTDKDGTYTILHDTPGTYWLDVGGDWPEYGGGSYPVQINAGQMTVQDYYLTKELRRLYPPNGATISDLTPTLTWEANPEAATYTLQVNVQSTFELVLNESNITGTSYTFQDPLPKGIVYVWIVTAFDTYGHMVAYSRGPDWTFTIEEELKAYIEGRIEGETEWFHWDVLGTSKPELKLELRGTNSQGEIVRYEWDFGDGSTAEGEYTSHTYYQGNWNITLTVYDKEGNSASETLRIEVRGVRTEVDVETKYWEDGSYDLRVTAQAAPYDVASIQISGPHIDTATVETGGGDQYHLYDDGNHHDGEANDGLWWVLLNIQEPPVVGETITFYITYSDDSSETKQKSIDGVLSETAQLLSPPDGSTVNTLTPTFEWSNPSISGLTYSVQINDINWNRVYEVYYLPDGTTSHEIPADYLNWGATYYWLVSASDVNGNEALTNWDTFTTTQAIDLGYAIILAGQAHGLFGLTDRQWFGHSADNAYRVLRNLGFDDNHIFYLNSQRQLKINGKNVVDAPASISNFQKYLNEIKDKIGDNPTPFILFLVGHGDRNIFVIDPENEAVESLIDADLRHMLEDTSFDPALIAIWSCDSGSFITRQYVDDSISVEGENRIIITATHEGGKIRMYDLAQSSDRLWGNLNEGLNVKEAYVKDVTKLDIDHRLLDDNGDQKGNPPDDLGKDGDLAAKTVIGMPGTEELELVDWYWALMRSPGELRVYDSHNRITGLIKGEVKQEIPGSMYDERDEIVAIFSPSGTYRYQVVGTGEETYGLDVASIRGSEITTFTATDIPTTPGAVHQYTIDWQALSQGQEGVTVQMDSDGDGTFELTFTTGTTLVSMTSFVIDYAKINFGDDDEEDEDDDKDEDDYKVGLKDDNDDDDDYKVRVKGNLELNLVNGDGVDISEDVIVKVGPLSETIKMKEKGKKGKKWEYKRPKGGEGNIKKMTIDWKKGKFDIRMDRADLSGITNPVTITLQIGDDFGSESILMKEKKHYWVYNAKKDSVEESIAEPKFSLSQNYPNPCNPETTIEYGLAESCHVILKIYNISGQLIKTLINEYQQAGFHKITWHGDNEAGEEVASGVYFYRLQAGDKAAMKKMVVLK